MSKKLKVLFFYYPQCILHMEVEEFKTFKLFVAQSCVRNKLLEYCKIPDSH